MTAGMVQGGPGATQAAAGRAVLELHLGELRQLFNSMDPAPFRERDLDPKATDYIVDWATEAPAGQALAMVVRLDKPTPDGALPGDAVREYFQRRAVAKRRELSKLFRVGRISLVIGLAFLGGAISAGEALGNLVAKDSHAYLLRESLAIGGWVALWRPLEIFLYDWWPLRAQARLYDRLGAMQVTLRGAETAA
ncbi:MAG TPA: hypothetical protein PLO41_12720 [Rubrivivax sp.]|nr:hypothetical protein [Rubrivivax sp.]